MAWPSTTLKILSECQSFGSMDLISSVLHHGAGSALILKIAGQTCDTVKLNTVAHAWPYGLNRTQLAGLLPVISML